MDTKLNINAIEELSIPVTKLKDPENLTTGFANDLTGRNEATAEEFTLRPSAGNISIRDDSATIKRIKGNSVVWNQMVNGSTYSNTQTRYGLQCSVTSNSREIRVVGTYVGDTSVSDRNWYTAGALTSYSTGIVGHKYLCHISGNKECSLTVYGWCSGSTDIFDSIIKECTSAQQLTMAIKLPLVADGTQIDETIIIDIHDLTAMFGVGNEPDTVEEFRALFPGNHYEYNPGQLVSMTANGLFTNGFNQWDEEWELGYLNADGTTAGYVQNYIRAKNYIPVISGVKYYAKLPNGVSDAQLYAVDENYNLIKPIYLWRNTTFVIPDGAAYIRFYLKYGSEIYNNDICINLSHTGVENGKYEPYWDATKDLSIIQKYFPNGMRSAGSIYDEISFDETTQKWVAIQRVGNVDLGSLSWSYSEHLFSGETVAGFKTSIEDVIFTNAATTLPNITVSKYNINTADKVANGYAATETFTGYKAYKTDLSAYFTFTTDASEFKSSLSGVILNYELAEPIITVIEEPVDLSYKVGDFGIEQILSDSFSAPFRADIIYQFNATDRIRENSLNIEKLSKTQKDYLPLTGGTMSGQINSQDIKPVEDSTYQLGDSTHKYDNVFSNFFTGDLEGNAKTATDLTGRIEATPEVFTYHPSAGEKSIKDDNAFIRRVKGNSVVWNQLVGESALTNNGVTPTTNNGVITLSGTPTTTWFNVTTGIPVVLGHKMLLQLFVVANPNNINVVFGDLNNKALISSLTGGGTIYEVYGQTTHWLAFNDSDLTNIDFTGYQMRLMYTDLTQMFGVGNEPDTVEEFRALYPNFDYPYNPGELRNLDCSGIKTVGFNQWDEQWEVGGLGTDEYGSPITFDGMIRSTNYNPIFPSTEYYIRTSNVATYIWYYDSDKKYIGRDIKSNSRFFITPTNAAYFKLRIGDTTNTITTYNHDICINLHHTGYRDGKYEPYKEVTHALPLSKITNGEPLRKAGSVYDEINETEYIKRVGVVDLGSYDWHETPNGTFQTVVKIPDIKAVESESNYTCEKYIGISNPSLIFTGTADNLTISTNAAGRIYIRDDAYKTGTAYAVVPALKASLSGVLLHYELAEPIVTPIETPIDFNYYVEDFGTEEALLTEDSAPFSADIVYQFNATDTIRVLEKNIKQLLNKITSLENIIANAITNSNNL